VTFLRATVAAAALSLFRPAIAKLMNYEKSDLREETLHGQRHLCRRRAKSLDVGEF
jgi:hypothetical protein